MSIIALPLPQVLELVGNDAIAFAQAQFSSDVRALTKGHWQWSAWLSAQGRVRAFFQLLRDDHQRLRVVLRGGSATALRDALSRYVLRTKVELRVIEYLSAYQIVDPADVQIFGVSLPQNTTIAYSDTAICITLPGSRYLILRNSNAAPIIADESTQARNRVALADIENGLVTVDSILEDRLLPDWIGLRNLGAVSIDKGCYPGQEIIARLHFKGGNKRWLYKVAFAADALPAPATSLATDTQAQIVNAAWREPGNGVALAAIGEAELANVLASHGPEFSVLSIERVTPKII